MYFPENGRFCHNPAGENNGYYKSLQRTVSHGDLSLAMESDGGLKPKNARTRAVEIKKS